MKSQWCRYCSTTTAIINSVNNNDNNDETEIILWYGNIDGEKWCDKSYELQIIRCLRHNLLTKVSQRIVLAFSTEI